MGWKADQEELTDQRGADKLAKRITDYWAARGAVVKCEVSRLPFSASARATPYAIVSDLVDGRPRPEAYRPIEPRADFVPAVANSNEIAA